MLTWLSIGYISMLLTAVPYLLCAIWQMETMKKAYHGACKEEKLATSRENNSKLENNSNPEAQKKLQDKVEKCQQEMEKVGMGVGGYTGVKTSLRGHVFYVCCVS